MTPLTDSLVLAVRQHLQQHHIRHSDIAAALGCNPSYVSNVLSRHAPGAGSRTTLRALERILDVLGLEARVTLVEAEFADPRQPGRT